MHTYTIVQTTTPHCGVNYQLTSLNGVCVCQCVTSNVCSIGWIWNSDTCTCESQCDNLYCSSGYVPHYPSCTCKKLCEDEPLCA